MRNFRLNRRALLRGAGGVAITLPWLEVMQPIKVSRAAESPARRFIAVYTPGGTVLDAWTSLSTAQLGPILAPLSGIGQELVVVQGLNMACAVGEQAQSGMIGLLTGCAQERGRTVIPNGSLDEELAKRLGSTVLYQAVRWATGPDAGQASPANVVSYGVESAQGSQFEPQRPAIDPAATWQRLFGKLPSPSSAAWKKSILDATMARYAKLSQQLGAADKRRLETHLDLLRSLERSVKEFCAAPTLVDTTGYDPLAGPQRDATTDAAIPTVGKLMMDMLVMALGCELTSVATLQWADSSAAYTLPWLDLPGGEAQNFYENDGGYDIASMTKIFTWYSTQHAYLLEQMANVDLGGHSLLDESVVLFGSHQQSPATHAKDNLPLLLAGGGGGLKGGRVLNYNGDSHNDLLVSIANLFGDPRQVFGDQQYCRGPLVGL